MNLYSCENNYVKQDIQNLRNLKRIYSENDSYETKGSCLIEDLFKNNKLEYVYVHKG